MNRFSFFFIVLGTIVPGTLHSQSNNRIAVQTGLFHCFFDGSPMLNTNYRNKDIKPFGGLLYNSVGLQYLRKSIKKNRISIEYMYYYHDYWNVSPNVLRKTMHQRGYSTFNVTYEREVFLSSNFCFTYGGGINYRNGSESVVVNYGLYWDGEFHELLVESRDVHDIGLNLRTGIEYTPVTWLTLYSKFDCIGFAYMNSKKTIQELQDVYDYKSYPHRFDLSWRFGIGFNFGK